MFDTTEIKNFSQSEVIVPDESKRLLLMLNIWTKVLHFHFSG